MKLKKPIIGGGGHTQNNINLTSIKEQKNITSLIKKQPKKKP
jgi:hypothetical protein